MRSKIFVILSMVLMLESAAIAEEFDIVLSGSYLRKEPAEKVIWYGGLVAKMIFFYGQSCDNAESEGCFNLANIYDTGDASVQNKAKASGFYKQACEGGVALACNNLGILHAQGDGTPQDHAKALNYFDKACALKEEIGCKNSLIIRGASPIR